MHLHLKLGDIALFAIVITLSGSANINYIKLSNIVKDVYKRQGNLLVYYIFTLRKPDIFKSMG